MLKIGKPSINVFFVPLLLLRFPGNHQISNWTSQYLKPGDIPSGNLTLLLNMAHMNS